MTWINRLHVNHVFHVSSVDSYFLKVRTNEQTNWTQSHPLLVVMRFSHKCRLIFLIIWRQ